MFKILRDLLRYNREFAIGFTLTAGIFLFALAQLPLMQKHAAPETANDP